MSDSERGEVLIGLPADAFSVLCERLPRAEGFDDAMDLAEHFRQTVLGDGLMTVNRVHAASERDVLLQRIWSSRPHAYPVGGTKLKSMTNWTRQLLLRGELFIGEGLGALEDVFDDVQLIASMGLRAVMNVPLVRQDGSCFATFNVLGTRERWTSGDQIVIRLLAELMRPQAAGYLANMEASPRSQQKAISTHL
ncbi:GAF domain-containing protein [Ottowia thiooxydans]|uniref:GAF domain-containing protein n=1 Tax=Ottowia thiooxydans TaxID=219182 RepID=A0ABV2Q497_9BURK